MRFAQASFRGIHNRQMPPMWVVVEPCRGVFAWHFLTYISRVFCARYFECLFVPDVSSVCLRPIFRVFVCARYFARFAPVCVGGRCPYSDVLPLQGAIPFKPSTWGNPGCRSPSSCFTLGWDTIASGEVRLHLSIALESKLSSLCIRFALTLPLQGAAGSKPLNYSTFYVYFIS